MGRHAHIEHRDRISHQVIVDGGDRNTSASAAPEELPTPAVREAQQGAAPASCALRGSAIPPQPNKIPTTPRPLFHTPVRNSCETGSIRRIFSITRYERHDCGIAAAQQHANAAAAKKCNDLRCALNVQGAATTKATLIRGSSSWETSQRFAPRGLSGHHVDRRPSAATLSPGTTSCAAGRYWNLRGYLRRHIPESCIQGRACTSR